MRTFGSEGRVLAVSGVEDRLVVEAVEDLGLDVAEERSEGVVVRGLADAAGEP
ncbi:hypothetical protein Y013_04910 [Rhodococcus pyridinivorans SB3094]|uniref:Uncharacterized protein n=1 Tax=Rhodococcus pyridinivorans SB3094 TaxID=1435356 RepID=V9XMK9_9NOCA|nr:hypothetical protein Y013_04910 [Rhodococcus pyridinivorans SB3094]